MKKIIYLLISFLIISCNTSRKVNAEKNETTDRVSINEKSSDETKSQSGTSSESGSSSVTDFSKFWSQNNLKVKSNGSAFNLSYNGMTFSGDADVDISNSQEQIKYYNVFSNYNIFHHFNVYHHFNITEKQNIYYKHYAMKSKGVDTQKNSFWMIALVFSAGMATMLLILWLWKKYNPLQIIKRWIK